MSESAPAPPPPPPPPPPPGWKPNWRESQGKPEPSKKPSQPLKIPNAPQSPRAGGSAPQSPHQGSGPDGSFTQYDLLPDKLQSTLSKDKKPFTYTPAGIDLSEIKSSKFQKKVNRAKNQPDTVCGPGSPELNEYGQQPPLWPDDIQDISEYCNNPAELDNSMTNPRYTGSKIPSRSFRVLQAMTSTSDDDDCNNGSFSPRVGMPSPTYGTLPRPLKNPLPPPVPPPPSFSAAPTQSTHLLDFAPPPPAPSHSNEPILSPPPVPPPPAFYAPTTSSLYSRPIPIYKKVPPPVPPKPQRGIFRDPLDPVNQPMPCEAPPVQQPPPAVRPLPSQSTPIAPSVPPRPWDSNVGSCEWPTMPKSSPFTESFYQSTVKPVFRSYNPPPKTRQTVRSGPGFNETTTESSGPGFQETTTYATYTSPSYSDGTQTLPLRRGTRQASTRTTYQSKPYYESPYQSVLETPQFQDPFKYGMQQSYANPHLDHLKYGRPDEQNVYNRQTYSTLQSKPRRQPQSAPLRDQPFFEKPNQTINSSTTVRETKTTNSERPVSMTTRFFDEINQLFDQTSANISREMYGTDF